MDQVNSKFAVSFLIILLGYIIKKTGLIKQSETQTLSKILFNITLPALSFNTIIQATLTSQLLVLAVVSFIFGIGIVGIGLLVFKKEPMKYKGLLTMLCAGFNAGLFAFPLVEAMLGEEGLLYIAVFDIGNSLILFIVIFLIANIYSSKEEKIELKTILKKFTGSMPLKVIAISLIIKLLGIEIPTLFVDFASTLSGANTPIALILMGMYFNFSIHKDHIKNVLKVIFVRYGVGLIIGILIYHFTSLHQVAKSVVLVGLILPIPVTTLTYTIEYEYDNYLAGSMLGITAIISFIFMWIMVLLKIV